MLRRVRVPRWQSPFRVTRGRTWTGSPTQPGVVGSRLEGRHRLVQRDDPGRSFAYEPFYARAHQIAHEIEGADAAYGASRLPCAEYELQLQMMWAGLYANVPVVNGYSGRQPNRYPFQQAEFSIDLLGLAPVFKSWIWIVTR